MSKNHATDEMQPIKQLEEKFCAFLEATSLLDGIQRAHVYLGRSYGRNNALLGWSDKPYQDAIEAVQQLCRTVSKKTIARVLNDSMVRLFEQHAVRENADPEVEAHLDSILHILDRSAIEKEVIRFLDFLKSQVQWYTVLIPIEGVELKLAELKIGEAILYPTERGPLITNLASPKDGMNSREFVENYIKPTFREAGCYAVIEVEGDSGFATQQALQKAQDIVHILNLYMASCRQKRSGWQKIGVMGQPTMVREELVIYITSPVGEHETQPRVGFSGRSPPGWAYEIDSAKVQKFKDSGLDEVSACFRYRDSNPALIRSRIRRSVTWYSKGVNADNSDEQFVALAIALESLLVGKEERDLSVPWGSIAQRLADRVAFLIGRDYAKRVNLAKETKRLYRIRSKIVHQGQSVSLENLDRMNNVVAEAILAFVGRNFASWEDFLEWEKRQKYTVDSQIDRAS